MMPRTADRQAALQAKEGDEDGPALLFSLRPNPADRMGPRSSCRRFERDSVCALG